LSSSLIKERGALMKSPIVVGLVSLISALGLAGCSRHYVKETVVERPPTATNEVVVEKPVVVERPTVVERPAVVQKETTVVERPAVVTTTSSYYRSCTLGSGSYSDGSLSCQNRYQYRCDDGRWVAQYSPC
jgi:hypothetical protein